MSVYSGLVQLLQVSLSVSCVLWPLFYLCCCCCYYLTATINNETFWNCDWMNGFNISSSALKEWSPEEGWTRNQVSLHMYICGDPFNECTQVLHSGQFGCTFEQDKGQWWWWWWLTFHFLLFNSQLFIVYILLQCLCCHHHNNISTLFINYQNPSRQVSGPSQVHHTKEKYNRAITSIMPQFMHKHHPKHHHPCIRIITTAKDHKLCVWAARPALKIKLPTPWWWLDRSTRDDKQANCAVLT